MAMELEFYPTDFVELLQKTAQAYRIMTGHIPHFICPHSEAFKVIRELFAMYKSKIIELSLIKSVNDSCITPAQLEKEIRKNTALIFLSRYNPYTGRPQPVADIYKIAQEHKIPVHVDFQSDLDMTICNSSSGWFPFVIIEKRFRRGYRLEEQGNSFLKPVKRKLPIKKSNMSAKLLALEMLKKKINWAPVGEASNIHGNSLLITGPTDQTLDFQSPLPKGLRIVTELQFPLTQEFVFQPVSFLVEKEKRLIQLVFGEPLASKDLQKIIKAMSYQ